MEHEQRKSQADFLCLKKELQDQLEQRLNAAERLISGFQSEKAQ
jgi:hypothetical protein